jgi:hypothetical protein
VRRSRSLAPRSRLSRLLAGGVGAFLTLSLAACGSATATHQASTAATATTTTAATAAVGIADTAAPTATPAACASAVAGTLGQVGERIYHEAATGGDVAEAVHRVQSSAALASAIDSGSADGARAALRALLLGQIVRIEVLRDGHLFAAAGAGSAIAPVRGSIPGTGASFVLSVQSDHGYQQVAQQVTGAQVRLNPPAGVPERGALSHAGESYQVVSLKGAVYPSGALRIALLVPSSAISCPASIAQARVETLGHVGERIYEEELHSASVDATLRLLERSPSFRNAVAAQDAAATHAAIDGFFKAHIHVVRVRVTIGQRLLIDVGGPYALAPVHGTLRINGRVVGQFEMAIQDDAGYLKLAHLFTGAGVLMRVGGQQVEGTLSPGPATVPERGALAYGGRSYETYSFTAEAFPSGPLRISLLIPA